MGDGAGGGGACATFLCDQKTNNSNSHKICSVFDMHVVVTAFAVIVIVVVAVAVVVVVIGSTIRLRSYINYFTVIMHLKHAVTISALS